MPQNSILDRLRATQRYPAGQDAFVSRRMTEIDSGADDMVEDMDSPEAHMTQQDMFEDRGYAPSRADLRTNVLTKLRRTLKLKDLEHGKVMERERQKAEIEAASQERQNQYSVDRFNMQQDRMDQRQQQQIAATDRRYNQGVDVRRELQDDQQEFNLNKPVTARGGVPTNDMLKRYQESREAMQNPGPMARLGRMLGVSDDSAQRQAYEASLSDILMRSGKFDTVNAVVQSAMANEDDADAVIAELENAGVPIDPYEREYLTLKLGRRTGQ